MNQSNRRRAVRGTILAMAIILALSVSAIASAQSTPIYQFGCWGVMSTGGGTTQIAQTNGTNELYGSIGQWSAGISSNNDYTISSGHISPMAYGRTGTAAAIAENAGPPSLYLPFVGNFVEVVYVCPY